MRRVHSVRLLLSIILRRIGIVHLPGETADSDDGDILSALIDTFQSDEEDVEEKPPKSLTTESSSLNKVCNSSVTLLLIFYMIMTTLSELEI